jgi:hypothetical protein|tara:strand:+ start:84 stop:596 length:513 start_codon:yes stop_codon:yes gene_type:complete
MKNCKNCKKEKQETEFYFRKDCSKYRNECIVCWKEKCKTKRKIKETSKEFIEKERIRGREKYKRLYSTALFERKVKYKDGENHYIRFPEKHKATYNCRKLIKKGFHAHHWSYNEEHFIDIFYLTPKEHMMAHRYLIYDEERKMYRTINNILLDTKAEHEKYIKEKINQPF